MTYETPFGSTVEADLPFDLLDDDGDQLCGCGAGADHDGTICGDCFDARWTFPRPTDPMVELLDDVSFEAPTPTNQLAA